MPQKQFTTKQQVNGCATLVFFIIIFGLFFWLKDDDTPVKKMAHKPDKYDAYYDSRQFITQKLKAPGTAKFNDMNEGLITQVNDSTFVIRGTVDSENSFGALLRANYACKISYTFDNKVRCEDVVIL